MDFIEGSDGGIAERVYSPTPDSVSCIDSTQQMDRSYALVEYG